ncbi:MAG: tRNA (guanosine(46)-N7)-methyltransferase TrmB [Lachnospiraceae bacterium]|nr:tRNA (guanosine(46)-N7)-methyltransferase TrmB [Lachnospiraceae bacterium]
MRLRNITGSRDIIAESDFVIHDETAQKGMWKEVFGNDLPIRLEIGMGKGRFIMDMAEKYPEANYLGIEKYSSVLLRAIQKMEERTEQGEELNVRFIRMDAEYICDVFEEGEVDRIYLNFSDPWPKDRHAKRRLESRQFLERYDRILKKDGRIEFKTDNRALFDFAVEEVEASAFKITALSYDLHADKDMMQGNVMTEYEEKFSSMGNPICKYILERR